MAAYGVWSDVWPAGNDFEIHFHWDFENPLGILSALWKHIIAIDACAIASSLPAGVVPLTRLTSAAKGPNVVMP